MALGDGLNCSFDFSLVDFCRKYHLPTLRTDSALRILTRMGYLEYVEEMEYSSRVQFIIPRDELFKLQNLPAEYESLITALLRNYSGIFTDFVFIDERYLAGIIGVTRHRMYEILVSLSQRRIIHFVPSKRCPIVTFTRHRVFGHELRFAPQIYDERRDAFDKRISSMLAYAVGADECRSKVLLSYFGQTTSESCGCCDVCMQREHPVLPYAGNSEPVVRILEFLSDGKSHAPADLEKVGLTRRQLSAAVRYLCDEEKILIENGLIRIHKKNSK